MSSVRSDFRNLRPAIPVDATESVVKQAVAGIRAGEKLTPKRWPGGARVAACISFDIDNEFPWPTHSLEPVRLSVGQYGAITGLPRILALLDRVQIPASFYIPAMSAALHPQMIEQILERGRHEIGVHGWTHEHIPSLKDADQEADLLGRAIDYLTRATGRRPVGYRAPSWAFGTHTLDLIRKAGFLYDSSLMAMDEPYRIQSDGQDTDLIEIPVNWTLDDYMYFGGNANGSLPTPQAVFAIFRTEFDVAYEERTLFMVTLHPHVCGQRSRIGELEALMKYVRSKRDVWCATAQEIAEYVKQHGAQDQ